MNLKIYSDSLVEGSWFEDLSPLLADAEHHVIKGRGDNPVHVDRLVEYDRPDIILTADDEPVLVVEKTREVPTGHNIGQRYARIVRAAELDVPVIKFFPYDARKHGTHTSICNLNIRMLEGFERMWEIHETPVLAVNWPSDDHGELIDDGGENERMQVLVHEYVASGFDAECPAFLEQRQRNREEYETRLRVRPAYARPPGSVAIVATQELLNRLADEGHDLNGAAASLGQHRESVVYTIGMTPDSCRREDPYTGMQFVYDYTLCRTGPDVSDKARNLILHFPKLDRATWYACNPNDPMRKSCNWYLTANAFVFKDGVEVLR